MRFVRQILTTPALAIHARELRVNKARRVQRLKQRYSGRKVPWSEEWPDFARANRIILGMHVFPAMQAQFLKAIGLKGAYNVCQSRVRTWPAFSAKSHKAQYRTSRADWGRPTAMS